MKKINIKRSARNLLLSTLMLSCALPSFTAEGASAEEVQTQTTQAGSSNGLIVKLYGSKFGLSGFFKESGLFGVTKSEDADYNLLTAANQLKMVKSDIKRISMEGYITPSYTEDYTFTTNHNDDVKLWVNGDLILVGNTTRKIALTAGEYYSIRLELDSNAYESIEVKWRSASQSLQVIPTEKCYVPVASNDKTTSMEVINRAPLGDQDEDGIPNEWEKNGFMVIGGVVLPYDESFGAEKYVTDYTLASSDGDPFSDLEEATGIGMDRSVKEPGNHPLVAAYPSVEFVPTSVNIIRNIKKSDGTIESSKTSKEYKVTSIASSMNSNGGIEKGKASVNTELGVSAKLDTAKGEASVTAFGKLDVSGGKTYGSKNATAEEQKQYDKTVLGITDSSGETSGEEYDTTNYASLLVNGYYRNKGLATAYDIDPLFTLKIGEELYEEDAQGGDPIKSFAPIEGQKPKILGPQLTYPEKGSVQLSLTQTTGKVPKSIRLTKKQTDKLELGYPFQITVATSSSKYGLPNLTKEDWNIHLNAIKENCATIRFQLPKGRQIENKVYAKTETGGVRLLDALKMLYKTELNDDNELVIEGEEIDTNLARSQWGLNIFGSEAQVRSFINSLEDSGSVDMAEITLTPGLEVELFKKDGEATALIMASYYNLNDEKIYAVAIPTGSPIKTVEAKVSDGEEKTLTMSLVEGSSYTYASERVRSIRPDFDNKVVVTCENDMASESKVQVDAQYLQANATTGMRYIKYPYQDGIKDNLTGRLSGRAFIKNYINDNPSYKYFSVAVGFDWWFNHNYRWSSGSERYLGDMQRQRKTVIGDTVIAYEAEDWGEELYWPNVTDGELVLNYSNLGDNNVNVHYNTVVNGTPMSQSSWVKQIYKKNGQKYVKVTGDKEVLLTDVKGMLTATNSPYVPYIYVDIVDGSNNDALVGKFEGAFYKYSKEALLETIEPYHSIRRNYRTVLRDVKFYYSENMTRRRHTQTAVVSREDILAYLDEPVSFATGLYINGIFADDEQGKVFVPAMTKVKETLATGKSEVLLGEDDVDTVLMNVRKKNRMDYTGFHLGNDWLSLGTGSDDEKHQDLAFVDVSDEGKYWKETYNGSIEVEYLGYFKDIDDVDANEVYWQYWIPQKKIRTSIMPDGSDGVSERQFRLSYKDLNVKGLPVRPRAYILKVDQNQLGSKGCEIKINNQTIQMDVGFSDSKFQSFINSNGTKQTTTITDVNYRPADHTAYVYVLANSEDPYTLDMELDIKNRARIIVDGQNIQIPDDIDVNVDPQGNLVNPEEIDAADFTIPEGQNTRFFVPIEDQIYQGSVNVEVVGFMYEN